MVKRLFDIGKVPFLELFNLATIKKPFFPQRYGQYTTCGQKHNSIDDNHCGFCFDSSKSNEELLHFPVCVVWLYNGCFHMGLTFKCYDISIFLYLIKTSLSFSEDLICDFQWISLILFQTNFISIIFLKLELCRHAIMLDGNF